MIIGEVIISHLNHVQILKAGAAHLRIQMLMVRERCRKKIHGKSIMNYESAWPGGKRCALSFTFDDSRASQLDAGIPIFDRHGLKATFYVIPWRFEPHADKWRAVAQRGHEIGNHTTTHPCNKSAEWSRNNAVEDFTLERMAGEIDGATEIIKNRCGVTPVTFAYPCGIRYVGEGETRRSYEPLVKERFLYARGDTIANSPIPIRVSGTDGEELERLLGNLEEARRTGGWMITVGHEVGPPEFPDPLTTRTAVLTAFCEYLTAKGQDVWVAPVVEVVKHLGEEPDLQGCTFGFVK